MGEVQKSGNGGMPQSTHIKLANQLRLFKFFSLVIAHLA